MRKSGRKVAKHCVFTLICGSGGLKSRLAEVVGAESPAQVRNEKICAPRCREAYFQVKVYKTHNAGTTFGKTGVETTRK